MCTRTRRRASAAPHAAGFTLVELMVVVAIIGILAGASIFAIRKNRSRGGVEQFAADILFCMKEARGLAVATGRVHAVQIAKSYVRWCEVDCPPNQPNTPGIGLGPTMPAVDGAQAASFARVADIGIGNAPAMTAFTDPIVIYFKPDGTLDSDKTTTQVEGFTVRLNHEKSPGIEYRVAVLPLSGEMRKYSSW